MTFRLSAPRPKRNSPGAAKNGRPEITIIATEDIAVWPSRMDGSVLMYGDFVMKDDAKMHSFYGTVSTQDASFESEGEEDALVIPHNYVVEHPGDDVDSENFMQSWFGVPCIIIENYCDGSLPKVYGTDCAPLSLQLGFIRNNEKTAYTMTFNSFGRTNLLPGRYQGNFSFAEPFDVADNEAIALDKSNGHQYKLAPGTGVAIDVASNNFEHFDNVTLIGSGGATPDTLAGSTDLVLTGTWTALSGATLSLKVFDTGSGKILIEQKRT